MKNAYQVLDIIIERLLLLGFDIEFEGEDWTDVFEALNQVRFIRVCEAKKNSGIEFPLT